MPTSNNSTKDNNKVKGKDLHLEAKAKSPSTDSRFSGNLYLSKCRLMYKRTYTPLI